MSFLTGKRFTFFDVETPNKRNGSIISIGICTIDENGKEESKYYLINPEERFDDFNIKLTGITPMMVSDKPTFDEVWEEIERDFTNAIVVAHNASFDLNVLDKCLDKYNIRKPHIYYTCTLKLAQQLLCRESSKLNDLCYYFGIGLPQHHSADCDAKACMEIFKRIDEMNELDDSIIQEFIPKQHIAKANDSLIAKAYNSLYGILTGIYFDNVFKENEISALENWLNEYSGCKNDKGISEVYNLLEKALEDRIFEYEEYIELFDLLTDTEESVMYNDATVATQVLLGILRGIVSDERINELELVRLKKWVEKNAFLKGNYPYDTIYTMIENVLLDGTIDSEEHEMLLDAFNNFVNPKKEDCSIDFNGKSFCLTGGFNSTSRSEVEEKIQNKGGLIAKGVTKKTDYLVIGGAGSDAYKFGNYGSKVNKAMQLQEKGGTIKIVSEEHLLELLETACACCSEDKVENMNIFELECDGNVSCNLEEKLGSFLQNIILESRCAEKELETIELKSKVKDQIISKGYSFKAYKNVWFRMMTSMKNVYRIELNNSHKLFDNLCDKEEYTFTKTKDEFLRVDINKTEKDLFDLLEFVKSDLMRVYLHLCENEPVDGFGCCGDYERCSDEKRCVKTDVKFAKGCAYRKNLLEGKIFYGKNRNI